MGTLSEANSPQHSVAGWGLGVSLFSRGLGAQLLPLPSIPPLIKSSGRQARVHSKRARHLPCPRRVQICKMAPLALYATARYEVQNSLISHKGDGSLNNKNSPS
jgi:hypothetical protein